MPSPRLNTPLVMHNLNATMLCTIKCSARDNKELQLGGLSVAVVRHRVRQFHPWDMSPPHFFPVGLWQDISLHCVFIWLVKIWLYACHIPLFDSCILWTDGVPFLDFFPVALVGSTCALFCNFYATCAKYIYFSGPYKSIRKLVSCRGPLLWCILWRHERIKPALVAVGSLTNFQQ